jgi:hypothetical protein
MTAARARAPPADARMTAGIWLGALPLSAF